MSANLPVDRDTTLRMDVVPEAVVDVAFIPPDPPYRVKDDSGFVPDYEVRNRYYAPTRRHALPVASPYGFDGSSTAFVQLAAKTLLWVLDWTAYKVGAVPDIPDPESQDPDWVLLSDHYEPASLELSADRVTGRWRISGVYVYAKKNPAAKTYQDAAFPAPPWMDPSGFVRTIPAQNVKQNIAAPQGGLAAGFAANARIVP
jgi:hypothetical protein